MKYIVDPIMFLLSGVSAALLLGLAVLASVYGYWMLCLLLAAAGIAFFAMAMDYGSTITMTKEGFTRTWPIPWLPAKAYARSQIAEVGVIGNKVFNKKDKSKVGTVYLYFSPSAMTEQERFQMALKWPRNVFRLRFSLERYMALQMVWDNRLEKYNIGDLEL